MQSQKKYVDLILPLKLKGTLSYCVPDELAQDIEVGSWVTVMMASKEYLCVVEAISETAPAIDPKKLKSVQSVVNLPKVTSQEMLFWHNLADYYMCSIGEVFKAAYSQSFHKQVAIQDAQMRKAEERAARAQAIKEAREAKAQARAAKQQAKAAKSSKDKDSKELHADLKMAQSTAEKSEICSEDDYQNISTDKPKEEHFPLAQLSLAQQDVFIKTKSYFKQKKPVLLQGVTGSGKTEIYMHLAKEVLLKGYTVLYLVPEIALSAQLKSRLESAFGDNLLIFNSKQTALQRKKVFDALKCAAEEKMSENNDCESHLETSRTPKIGHIVLGTRSSVMLPLSNLALVIIDEEHDASYKQTDPAPRYNGREAALMLARQCGANVIMGSATPSFEAQYNVLTGKYAKIDLTSKFYGKTEPLITIIDTNKAYRLRNMNGSFSMQLLNEIRKTTDRGEQVMIFRSRRAYSTIVQCTECGEIPKCPNCNVSLSYHKFSNLLECHYCGYHKKFTQQCPKCGQPTLVNKGSGTEKIEEELKSYFPQLVIARFDADTTQSKVQEQKLLNDFAKGNINILVGTQMITKGFDFDHLALVAVIQADSLFAVQDFRADERAYQLLQQLRGRAGRRDKQGMIMIQTAQPDHPVIKRLIEESLQGNMDVMVGLKEREMFSYPPYVRLMLISIKDRQQWRAKAVSDNLLEVFRQCGINNHIGPVAAPIEKVNGYHIYQYWIKLPRNSRLAQTKQALSDGIELVRAKYNNIPIIVVDVDPY